MRHQPRRVRNAMDERQRQAAESFADRERQEQQRRAATQAAEQRARAEAEARARAEAQAAAASVARRAAQQAGASSGPQLRTRQVLWEPSNDLPPMTAQQQEQARQEQEQARQEAERRRQREQQQRAAGLPVLRERQAIFMPNPSRPRHSLRDTLRELDREIARERRVRNPAERDSKDVPNDPTARALHRFQAAMGRGGFSAAIRASHARLGRMLEIEKLLGFKYAMRQLQRDYAHMPHARAALQELIERADAEIDNLENKPRPRRG